MKRFLDEQPSLASPLLEGDRCHIHIQGARAELHTSIGVSEAHMVIRLADVLAGDAQTASLLAFVESQVDGRHVGHALHATLGPPGDAEDTARKITVFVLGLIFADQEVRYAVSRALMRGGSRLTVRLEAGTVIVCVEATRLLPQRWRVTVGEISRRSAPH